MFSKTRWLVLALIAAFMVSSTAYVETAYAQKSKYGSSKSSSSSKPKYGSSAKPPASKPPTTTPSSSKPKYGTSSPPASTKPPTTTTTPPSSKPKYGTSNPTTPQSTPTTGQKPKYGTTGSDQGTTKPKFGTSGESSGTTTNKKPPTTTNNQSRSRDQAYSQRKYVESQQATAPPKPSYTTSNGQTVNVRTSSATVKTIRSKPSTYYTPQQRNARYTTVINNYHYSHPYDWYYSQPHYYVGGGYSSAFWYIMLNEWSAERRAMWLYHNQASIERGAYERGMKDAAVAAELAKLKAQNVAVNPDYVDKDFTDNPDLMYSQEYVEAAYNPTVVPPAEVDLTALWVILGVIVVGGVLYFVVFRMKVTS